MKLVFDSTTLIYFAKLKILDKLSSIKAEKIIPQSVYSEVVDEGKSRGKQYALVIESLVKKGVFKVVKAGKESMEPLLEIGNISYADAETLGLAKECHAIDIVDESYLRTIADIRSINYRGSVFLLFRLCRVGAIKKDEIIKYVDDMINAGWRCSTELYAAIVNETEKL